ncbi:MAG TPA: SOS response-associated peptidase [Gemmata sp.]|jgi:putative SOS response-associated peptidase YedK|nr:SOS response-associated peptidase [Gemmata sp.]
MCNRFAFASSPEELAEMRDTLGLVDLDKELLTPRYNIAPTTQIAVARVSASETRELARARWGLIPSWQKAGEKFPFLTNARSETAATKPSFRSAFKKRRCIIPASGFYEWKTVGKEKFPYFISMKTGLMPFAGLWERWESPDGPVESAAILTTSSNLLVGALHDRMPCILTPDQFSQWLDQKEQSADGLMPLLQPFAPERMEMWPVDRRVNSVKGGNDAGLIERVAG